MTEMTFLTKIAMFEDIFDEESDVSAIEAEEFVFFESCHSQQVFYYII